MRVLLLGSGGREHAFAWKIAQSSMLEALFIAPGNAGTRLHGKNIQLDPLDFQAVKTFVLENDINMVLVGPEEPLVKGIQDFFLSDIELKNVPLIGPDKIGAQLEGSKDFAKKFMFRHNIPTAKYATFTKDTLANGYSFLEEIGRAHV
jgi:phosphoribosylamine--glycine ligase